MSLIHINKYNVDKYKTTLFFLSKIIIKIFFIKFDIFNNNKIEYILYIFLFISLKLSIWYQNKLNKLFRNSYLYVLL